MPSARVRPSQDDATEAPKKYLKESPERKYLKGSPESGQEDAPDAEKSRWPSMFRDPTTPPGFISANAVFMERWDIMMTLLLAYVMTVTPYEVAFLEPQSVLDSLFWLNRVVDALFLLDMLMQFRLIPVEMNVSVEGSIADLKKVLRDSYLRGWFAIDLVSILPYDLAIWSIQQGSGSKLGSIRTLRIVRLARLFKIMKVLRGNAIVERYDDRVGISFIKLKMWKYLMMTLVSSHWMACILRLVPLIEDDTSKNWIIRYFGSEDAPVAEIYNVAWYWSIMTMTSVGYGDILPVTQAEIFVVTLVMIVGAMVFMFILGSVASLANAANTQEKEYFVLRENLNDFMTRASLPDQLCYRLRHFVRNQYAQGSLFEWSAVLEKLSPSLREEVAISMWAGRIDSNSFFNGSHSSELAALASIVVQRVYGAGEPLVSLKEKPETMYIIQKGLVSCEGKIVGPGQLVGEDMLYFAVHGFSITGEHHGNDDQDEDAEILSTYERLAETLKNKRDLFSKKQQKARAWAAKRDFRAVSISFCLAYQFSEKTLAKVLHEYPELLERVRRKVIREIFRRHIIAYTKAYNNVYNGASTSDKRPIVLWYERKIRTTLRFEGKGNYTPICLLQNSIRKFLSRKRMIKICAMLRSDPQSMHREAMIAIKEVKGKLGIQAQDPVKKPTTSAGALNKPTTSMAGGSLDQHVIRELAKCESMADKLAAFQQMVATGTQELAAAAAALSEQQALPKPGPPAWSTNKTRRPSRLTPLELVEDPERDPTLLLSHADIEDYLID